MKLADLSTPALLFLVLAMVANLFSFFSSPFNCRGLNTNICILVIVISLLITLILIYLGTYVIDIAYSSKRYIVAWVLSIIFISLSLAEYTVYLYNPNFYFTGNLGPGGLEQDDDKSKEQQAETTSSSWAQWMGDGINKMVTGSDSDSVSYGGGGAGSSVSSNVGSGNVASGNVASGNVASGNVGSGNVASGNVGDGSVGAGSGNLVGNQIDIQGTNTYNLVGQAASPVIAPSSTSASPGVPVPADQSVIATTTFAPVADEQTTFAPTTFAPVQTTFAPTTFAPVQTTYASTPAPAPTSTPSPSNCSAWASQISGLVSNWNASGSSNISTLIPLLTAYESNCSVSQQNGGFTTTPQSTPQTTTPQSTPPSCSSLNSQIANFNWDSNLSNDQNIANILNLINSYTTYCESSTTPSSKISPFTGGRENFAPMTTTPLPVSGSLSKIQSWLNNHPDISQKLNPKVQNELVKLGILNTQNTTTTTAKPSAPTTTAKPSAPITTAKPSAPTTTTNVSTPITVPLPVSQRKRLTVPCVNVGKDKSKCISSIGVAGATCKWNESKGTCTA
jgi:hypothetical protein